MGYYGYAQPLLWYFITDMTVYFVFYYLIQCNFYLSKIFAVYVKPTNFDYFDYFDDDDDDDDICVLMLV